MSASRSKGTRFESAIVAFLREHGMPWADRIALSGSRDRGDVTTGPGGPVIESKNVKQDQWAAALDEANKEAKNARAPFGVVWAHRRGKSSAGDGFVVMDGNSFVLLLQQAGYSWEPPLAGEAS